VLQRVDTARAPATPSGGASSAASASPAPTRTTAATATPDPRPAWSAAPANPSRRCCARSS